MALLVLLPAAAGARVVAADLGFLVHDLPHLRGDLAVALVATEEAPTRVRQIVNEAPKVGRNDPCPCGSGKKYKKCCLEE